jgi:hypothetical protein
MTFIERHLVSKIYEQLKKKQAILKHDHFFWFDKPINHKKKIIDRVNIWNVYHKNEILPSTFYSLDGKSLREIYFKLKNNDFYIYKKLDDNKSYKMRIKK